jgi:hypothetical protein
MPARKQRIPSYCHHNATGQAVVRIEGRDYYLGKYDTPVSRAEYDRLIAEWLTSGRRFSSSAKAEGLSIAEVILAYWEHVQQYYRFADGTPTTEVDNIRLALRPLRVLYADTAAAAFDALALESVREPMVRQGHCRNEVNKDIARLKRLFR